MSSDKGKQPPKPRGRTIAFVTAAAAAAALSWPAATLVSGTGETNLATAAAVPTTGAALTTGAVGTSGAQAHEAGTPAAGGAGVTTPSYTTPYTTTTGYAYTTTQPVPPYTVSPPSTTSQATVSTTKVAAVPRSFLGLSISTQEAEDYTSSPVFHNFIHLLNSAGNGPFVLRLGGTEADESYWNDGEATTPEQFVVAPGQQMNLDQTWMDDLTTVVQQTGMKVILNVNAGSHNPAMAAQYLQAAEQTLPPGTLIDAPVGNEPNLYSNPTNVVSHNQRWGIDFSAGSYAQLFSQYSRTLEQAFPTLPLAGPEVSAINPSWISTLLRDDPGQVGLVTTHIYPWNACDSVSSAKYPVTGYYLIASYPAQTADDVESSVQMAHDHGVPFRLTELGSATCGGAAGVNNTFAPALWSINQLFDLIDVGVNGVNIHIRADLPNTALQSVDGILTPSPFFYGLATVAKTLSKGASVTEVTGKFPANVKVWAVHSKSKGWHLLFVNSNATEQTVKAKVPSSGPLTESLLTAPSPASTTASLAGRTISGNGTWQGTLQQTTVRRLSGSYTVKIPADSAILGTAALASS